MGVRIKHNKGRCRRCDTVIESRSRHEMVWCTCGAVAVDGGLDYLRRAGEPSSFEDLSETEPVEVELASVGYTLGEAAGNAVEAERARRFSAPLAGDRRLTDSDAVVFLSGLLDDVLERAIRSGKLALIDDLFGFGRGTLARRVRRFKAHLLEACEDPI